MLETTKIQHLTEEHHRRPKSIGGTCKSFNISYLTSQEHRDWHTIVGNMNAYQICTLFNHIKYKPKNIEITCKFINGSRVYKPGKNHSKNHNKVDRAWKRLFKGMTFEEIVSHVNGRLLDPSYHLYIKYKN